MVTYRYRTFNVSSTAYPDLKSLMYLYTLNVNSFLMTMTLLYTWICINVSRSTNSKVNYQYYYDFQNIYSSV